jgi:hypothetical protein
MGKPPDWLRTATSKILPPSVDSATAKETIWANSYMPSGNDAVYALVAKYAEKQYDSILNHFDNADKKADEHLRFMTAAVGAVIALIASKIAAVEHPYVTLVGGIVLLVAFVFAMMAKTPLTGSFPMTPRALLAIADLETKPTNHQIESAIVASYQVAITGMRTIVDWKSRQVQIATYAFYVGFVLLLRSLLPN